MLHLPFCYIFPYFWPVLKFMLWGRWLWWVCCLVLAACPCLGMRRLLSRLRREFQAAGTPAKARQMKAYMKSAKPFHGVPAPAARAISKEVFADCGDLSQEDWEELVLFVWRNAEFREERYAAIYFCADKRWSAYQLPRTIRVYEEMIVTGAWWDYVDNIAGRVGEILLAYQEHMTPVITSWSLSPNMWLRRTSIISQLRFKSETDVPLLYACIEASLESKEFFLQKAIGWALREYAKTNPKEVRGYVEAKQDRLSPLSRREALKHLGG